MIDFSAIILSNTKSETIFETTMNCISTLVEHDPQFKKEIILVESNEHYADSYAYPEYVKVILPKEVFNFHRFLNFGIESATGKYIGLLNNDLIFQENWLSEIIKVSQAYPKILSFCPVDYNSKFTPKTFFEGDEEFKLGYDVRKHLVGWCIVAKKELFTKVSLDETFDFYFADDDYSLTLKKNNIKHAVVRNSEVIHLENLTTNEFKEKKDEFFKIDINRKDIPKELLKVNSWVIQDEKLLDGYIKFHGKWGSPRVLKAKKKIYQVLESLHMTGLSYYLYNTKTR